MVTNVIVVIGGLMAFTHVATNGGEHPVYKPGLKPDVMAGLICALVYLLWMSV